ncbi:MAG TPA: type VI secretion system tip protein TssI/VgrG [Polyangiaceae bacterium]|nr:type VI secretion system tip protein TssI/VgrG [Polyangiaceae bacterium]
MSESVGPVTVSCSIEKAEFEFRSMVGTEELGQPFQYELELLSLSNKHSAEKMLGAMLTVHLTRRDNVVRHFNGHITAFSLRGSIGMHVVYAVTVRPWLSLLAHRINCRIFKGTAVDIVKEVFADYEGIQFARVEGPEKPLPTYEFVMQYRESDLNFVMRVLERDGLYFYFEHEATVHTMVITDSERVEVPGFSTIRFHPPDMNWEQLNEGIDDWRPHYAFTAGKWGTTDFNFKAANVDLLAGSGNPPEQVMKEVEVFDFPGGYIENPPGEELAKRRLATLQVAGRRYEGQTNARGITAGQLFTMTNNPQLDLNKQYFVYSVHFQILSHARTSDKSITAHGDVMRASFVALDAARPFHPAPRTPKPSMAGIQTATVVGEKKDVEIDPDNFGRIKVRFHWDRAIDAATKAKELTGKNSCWVRVSQLWAGPSFGAVFHPRIGQEVLVDFIEGDPDQPIIIGRVHNSLNVPPYTSTTQSGIRTQSIPGGSPLQNYNEIRFEDKMGSEELYIQAEKTQTTKVKGSQSVSVGGGQSVSVGGSRSVSVTGPETYTVGKTRNVTVTKAVTETYNDTQTVTVANAQQMSAKTMQFAAEGGIALIQSDATQETLKDGNVQIIAANNIKLACGSTSIFLDTAFMNLDAKTKIQLKVGGTTIEIQGTGVKITAAGPVDISGATINLNSAG